MGIYNRFILPKIIDSTCRMKPNMKQREKVVPLAKGKVLEVGIGSGLNLPFYNKQEIKEVVGIDPSRELWSRNKVDTSSLDFEFKFIEGVAEDIPSEKNEYDTILLTYTLCTLPHIKASINEMKRVLKSDGIIIFCEHGLAPDKSIRFWQNFINPIWKQLGGGCNLNRNIPKIFETENLQIRDLKQQYIPGWKPASYNYWGMASK